MLQMEPLGWSRSRPLRGANAQTVPEYSNKGPEEGTQLSSMKVRPQVNNFTNL